MSQDKKSLKNGHNFGFWIAVRLRFSRLFSVFLRCCDLASLNSSTDFQFPQFLFLVLQDCYDAGELGVSIIIIIILLIWESFTPALTNGFSLEPETASLFMFPGPFLVFRPISNYVAVWMVSTRLLISKSSSPLVTVPSAPITTGITVTFVFHSFFRSSSKVSVLISLFAFFQLSLWSTRTAKSTVRWIIFFYFLFFFLLVVWPRLGDPLLINLFFNYRFPF